MSLSSLHCVLGHVDSSLHCEDDSSSLSRSMLSNVPRRQTFSEKGDMASVQGGWRRRAGLTGLGMYSTGRCQRLPWIPATIFCTTHVPSAMQNNTDLSNECRACEKGGQLPRRETRPRPLRLKRRTHIQQLLGTGIAHRARPLGGGDLHSEKHMWRFTNPTNHMWRSDREHRQHWRSAKGSQKVELMFGNTIQAVHTKATSS